MQSVIEQVEITKLFPLVNKKWLFNGIWKLRNDCAEGARVLAELQSNIHNFHLVPRIVFIKFSAKYHSSILTIVSDGEEKSNFYFNGNAFKAFTKSQPIADQIILLAATIGDEVKIVLNRLHQGGEYQRYFYLNGLATVLTEALTEFAHLAICQRLKVDVEKSFRISPGYKVWPDLRDQEKISKLLPLDQIGISVSESFQLHPEFSTTSMLLFRN